MLKRIVSICAVTAGLLVLAPAAHADTPTGNVDLGRQHGNVLRATLAENADGSGYKIRVYGSSPCTATRTDTDNFIRTMPPSWNDAVSRVYDYASCDTKLYMDIGGGGEATGWIDGGTGGKYVGPRWNDKTSSFKLS